MAGYRPMTAYGPRPEREHAAPDPVRADSLAAMCGIVSRAIDGRVFACSRVRDHAHGPERDATHYGHDRSGPVRLGYGR